MKVEPFPIAIECKIVKRSCARGMSGLNLISTYCSDSESTNTDDEGGEGGEGNRTLPLPACIASWRGVPHHEEHVPNDPSLHDGRNRTFDHVRGNWPTFVYVEFVPGDAVRSWMRLVRESMLHEKTLLLEQLHVSLSRTFVLKYHWIEAFVDTLKTLCHGTRSFSLQLTDTDVYLNEDKSRTFLAIRCEDHSQTLEHFTKDLDKLLAEYDLPPFYEGASHHVSFAWCLGDEETYLKSLLPSVAASFTELLATNVKDGSIRVNKLFCKIGNKLYAFSLR